MHGGHFQEAGSICPPERDFGSRDGRYVKFSGGFRVGMGARLYVLWLHFGLFVGSKCRPFRECSNV